MPRIQFEIQARANRVLIDLVIGLKLVDIKIGICRSSGQDEGLRCMEGVDDLSNGRYSLALRQRAWSGFDEIDAVAKPVALVASEKEYFVLHNRTTDRTPELVHAQWKLRLAAGTLAVEEIAGVQRVVPQEFEGRTVEGIASRLGHNADLASASGSEFGGVGVGFHAELLDVFQTALQFERRCQFTADDSRLHINNSGSLNSVVANRILFGCAAVESDIAVLAIAGVLRPRRLQVQLG